MKKDISNSCCGKVTITYVIDKPILRDHIKLFTDNGFLIPERYLKSNLFYARKEGFTATCSFGLTRIIARCSGNNCSAHCNLFESLLLKVEV